MNLTETFNMVFNLVKSKGTFIHSAKNPFDYNEWKFKNITIKEKDFGTFRKLSSKECEIYVNSSEPYFNRGNLSDLIVLYNDLKND